MREKRGKRPMRRRVMVGLLVMVLVGQAFMLTGCAGILGAIVNVLGSVLGGVGSGLGSILGGANTVGNVATQAYQTPPAQTSPVSVAPGAPGAATGLVGSDGGVQPR